MFLKTVVRQGKKILKLDRENKVLYEENRTLRDENSELRLQKYHSKVLAEDTLKLLNTLQDIDRKGNSEESKRKDRNIILNNLRKRNIDIIKELDVSETF